MDIYEISTIKDKKRFLKELNVEGGGISIMEKKMELLFFYINDLRTPAANILKQDALSIGAELAVPSGVILCEKSQYNCLLMGTRKHIELLSKKELAQPFGLKKVAHALQDFLKIQEHKVKIMGIINANNDSFFSASRFLQNDALVQIEKQIDEGADIIDIGAVSSRPNADDVSEEEELIRIQPICDLIQAKRLYEKVSFSIDSYTPSVIEYALKSGFNFVNDITGASDEKIIVLALKYNARLCIMHRQGTAKTMQNNPHYENIMVEISDFFQKRIEQCEALGLSRKNIVLDVGIGFGKSLEHNITLIKNMHHFKKFGCEVLVGASRKSMIDHIVPTATENRLAGTLAIHLQSVENGASWVRCHDVAEHLQALRVWEALQ